MPDLETCMLITGAANHRFHLPELPRELAEKYQADLQCEARGREVRVMAYQLI